MSADHVVVNVKAARFECKRCGETFGMSLPMEISQLARLSETFLAKHLACAEPAPAAEVKR